jgi:hypothetical protein
MNIIVRLLLLGALVGAGLSIAVNADARASRKPPADETTATTPSQEMTTVDPSANTDADADGVVPGSGNAANTDGSRDTSTGRANNDASGNIAVPGTSTTK